MSATVSTSSRDPCLHELGVCAYSPAAVAVVTDLHDRVRRWDTARRTTTGVTIEIHPHRTEHAIDALMTVDKRRTRVIVRPQSQKPLLPRATTRD